VEIFLPIIFLPSFRIAKNGARIWWARIFSRSSSSLVLCVLTSHQPEARARETVSSPIPRLRFLVLRFVAVTQTASLKTSGNTSPKRERGAMCVAIPSLALRACIKGHLVFHVPTRATSKLALRACIKGHLAFHLPKRATSKLALRVSVRGQSGAVQLRQLEFR
jgi:hypothetical protein